MEYKRLKENIETLCVHNERHIPVYHITDGKKHEVDLIREIVSDCREILDKIEQGKMIELPCRVGDTVYETEGVRIYEHKIDRIIYVDKMLIYDTNEIMFDERAIGESIFLTREEAEKRLKELQE